MTGIDAAHPAAEEGALTDGNGMWASSNPGLPLLDKVDPRRPDLRERFERSPLARHDAELQALVASLRGDARLPRYCLVSVGEGIGWRVARMNRRRGLPPEWVTDEVFADRDDAERWVFARRWELATGSASIDDVPVGVTTGAPLPLTKRILGYCDPLSAAPGDEVTFHVSCDPGIGAYVVDVVRMWCGNPREEGPPLRIEPVRVGVEGTYPGTHHPVPTGSYGLVPGAGRVFENVDRLVVRAIVAPTAHRGRPQTVLSVSDPWAGTGLALYLDERARPTIAVGIAEGAPPIVAAGGEQVPHGAWTVLVATVDTATGALTVEATDPAGAAISSGSAPASGAVSFIGVAGAPVVLGAVMAADGTHRHHFAGKLEAPSLTAGDGTVLAAWDLTPPGLDSWEFTDSGPHGFNGTLHNLPRRGVRGSAWAGSVTDWQQAPAEFAAIHLYPDALEDCGWPVAFSITVPHLSSGFYAARLVAGQETEWIPFFVRPPRGTRTSSIALLVPTATYAAYANSRFWWEDPIQEMAQDRLVELCAEEQALVTRAELAPSCYDRYADGTAVTYSSRRRPNLLMRPGHGRAELYASDLYLVDWLRHEGIDVDVITDEDLHHEGTSLLDGYTLVLTGTHPEYTSVRMYDALAAYIDAGGRLAYLGGNGICFNVAFSASRPWIMEDRATLQRWGDPDIGRFEMMHTVDGRYGSQLSELQRAPGTLVGVDFVSMGFDRSYPIVRTDASDDPTLAWAFEGIEGRFIGGRGLLGGGAIGQEWDNARLTADDARIVVLGTTADTSLVPAVLGSDRPYHGDVVLFARGKGVVFSVGSMSWCGCLPIDGYDNDVARMTANVVRRLADPAPVPLPESAVAAAQDASR